MELIVKESHKKSADGKMIDSVHGHTPFPIDMRLYRSKELESSDFHVPYVAGDDVNVRYFVANFDGTGNDMEGDPGHMTSVGWIHDQIRGLRGDRPVLSDYVEGPGTQRNFAVKLFDGATGSTYDARLEEMYVRLLRTARLWANENPDVQIRIIAVGFSRGAEEAAGFTRLVHERGIQDIYGLDPVERFGRDLDIYTRPPIAAPGSVPQSIALFDPVGTGKPHRRDRHLPSSVVSGLQITARDERRNAFPSSLIIPLGMSEDGRFWNFEVPGSHSDIGGSYHEDGLSILNGNYMAQYINAHFPEPVIELRDPPTDPTRYVIHHSEEHLWIYWTTVFDRDGQRDVVGAQVSPPHCRFVVLCAPPDAMDERFAPTREFTRPLSFRAEKTPEILHLERVMTPFTHRFLKDEAEVKVMDNHTFDLERHLSVGNIPVPSGYEALADATPESSLQTVSQPPSRDIAHDLQLLRDVQVINEHVRKELGPPPVAQPDRSQAKEKELEQRPELGLKKDRELHQEQAQARDVGSTPSPDLVAADRERVLEPAVLPVGTTSVTSSRIRESMNVEPAEVMPLSGGSGVPRDQPAPALASPVPRASASVKLDYPPTDPRNESHRDHRLYHSIHGQLDALHAKEGIALNATQMESLSLATLVTAKEHGLSAVTHVQFGQSPEGAVIPTIHAFEAFRGDLADPRTGWAGLTATDALKLPEIHVMQQLQDVNLVIDQRMAANEMDMSRQQGMGMSMSM